MGQAKQRGTLDQRKNAAIDRVSLTLDGDKWCALYGSNLQEGVAGFGKTPLEAIEAFDKEWCSKNGFTSSDLEDSNSDSLSKEEVDFMPKSTA